MATVTTVNRQITLAARPVGFPKVSDFQLAYSALPAPSGGEVLVRSAYLSLDPQLRLRMGSCEGADDDPEMVAIGEVLPSDGVAYVVQSEDPALRAGDTVEGVLGWQEYAIAPASELRKIDSSLAPISTALGVLGRPGLAAYFGLLEISAVQPGETVLISGAAGGVGMLAGQIAKILGCRVVGVVGSDPKVAWLITELGFDAAFNHKATRDYAGKLDQLCPEGIDVYFDNVGGALTDAVICKINDGARVTVCAQSSQYNLEEPEQGPRWLNQLSAKRAKIEGFRVASFAARFPQALDQLARWLKTGQLKYFEDIAQGIEAAPQAFIGMLQGKMQGRSLVQLAAAGSY